MKISPDAMAPGEIAMLTGKKLKWDPGKMRIVDNPEAAKLISRNMLTKRSRPWLKDSGQN